MLLALHTPLQLPIDLLLPSRDSLQIAKGKLLFRTEHALIIAMCGPVEPPPVVGQRVILDAGRARGLRVKGIVLEAAGTLLTVSYGGEVSSDARTSARFEVQAKLRFLACKGASARERWMAEGMSLPPLDGWRTAAPTVEMGLSGLWMRVSSPTPAVDEILLLSLSFSSEDRDWRAVARVARVQAETDAVGVGLEYLQVEDGALEELVQRALLAP